MSHQKYQEKLGGKATYFSTEIHLTGWEIGERSVTENWQTIWIQQKEKKNF
ncbi:MAG: hypothetical protein ACLR2O_08645 [Coprococcus sp.]